MFKRTILAAAAVCALAVSMQAQENATLVLRSGEKVAGQLVDMGGVGFTVRVNGQERQIATNDVSVIDFTGNGDVSEADLNRGQTLWLRNGQTVDGQLYDIAGTSPLKITLKTPSGDREFASSEVGRIVLSRPSARVATSGSSSTTGIPEGTGERGVDADRPDRAERRPSLVQRDRRSSAEHRRVGCGQRQRLAGRTQVGRGSSA